MAEVFISHARADADIACRLREGIEGVGLSVWMDTASMVLGERWTEEIESAIQAATSLVVVVSTASNASVWVRREVLYAQQRQMAEGAGSFPQRETNTLLLIKCARISL